MIYRIIFRNDGKFSIDEITALCCPKNLLNRKDHAKRFPENLRFWMKSEHQLWYESSEKKLTLSLLTKNSDPLPSDIANVTNKALFTKIVENIFDQETHDTKGFFRFLTCIIASDRFVFPVDKKIDVSMLDNFFSELLPQYVPPNNSEKSTLIEYAHFLGFIEKQENGYLLDPTRAIVGELSDIYHETNLLSINQFITQLGQKLPILDGGVYREEVEMAMSDNGWKKYTDNYVSKSLSHALFRLRRMKKIVFLTASDDTEALSLRLPDNKTQIVSSIQYLNGDIK